MGLPSGFEKLLKLGRILRSPFHNAQDIVMPILRMNNRAWIMKKLLCGDANRIFHQGSFGGRVIECEAGVSSWLARKEPKLEEGRSGFQS